jgi:hypothetical protein
LLEEVVSRTFHDCAPINLINFHILHRSKAALESFVANWPFAAHEPLFRMTRPVLAPGVASGGVIFLSFSRLSFFFSFSTFQIPRCLSAPSQKLLPIRTGLRKDSVVLCLTEDREGDFF